MFCFIWLSRSCSCPNRHKAGQFFEGNRIIILGNCLGHQPVHHFTRYLTSHNHLHPVLLALWMMAAGNVPTWSFFISHLRIFFNRDVAGQSMRAGGATCLAEHGVLPSIIQAARHWVSEAFLIYICKRESHPSSGLALCSHKRPSPNFSDTWQSSFSYLSSYHFYFFYDLLSFWLSHILITF